MVGLYGLTVRGCCAPLLLHPSDPQAAVPHQVPHPGVPPRSHVAHARFDSRRGGAARAASFEREIRPGETAARNASRAVPVYTSQNATTRPRPAPGCGSLRSRPPSRVARRSRAPRPPPGARPGRNVSLHRYRAPRRL